LYNVSVSPAFLSLFVLSAITRIRFIFRPILNACYCLPCRYQQLITFSCLYYITLYYTIYYIIA
jgi:hypothetical protein